MALCHTQIIKPLYCHFMGYLFWLTARNLLYAPSDTGQYIPRTLQYCEALTGTEKLNWSLKRDRSETHWSILHGVDPLSYFSFQPVLHDWCNKGRGMCYSVCGMVHIKEPLLLIDKSSLCGGSRFPFSLSEWSLTICLMPYNRIIRECSTTELHLNKMSITPEWTGQLREL